MQPNAPFVQTRYRPEGHVSMSRESRYIEAGALGLPSSRAASSQAGQQGGWEQGRSQEGGWQPSQKGCWKKGRWSNNG